MTAIVGVRIETIHVMDLMFKICCVTKTKGKNVPTSGPFLPINCGEEFVIKSSLLVSVYSMLFLFERDTSTYLIHVQKPNVE